jgi:hypothetical protein
VTNAASPARPCRRRGARAAAVAVLAGLQIALHSPATAAVFCTTPGGGWCVARRFAGSVPSGELGFRFGEPLDVDGDGRADVAAGARFKLSGTLQNGSAAVWSGATGAPIREWDGEWPEGLFGHWVMPVPDLSGDGLADVVIAAPHGRAGGIARGIVVARSPKTGAELWKRAATEGENFGWDMALAGDQNGDGRVDLFVGAPAEHGSRVFLVSGRDGTVLRTFAPREDDDTFGWYVARLDDLDGDGKPDLAVGGPSAANGDGARVGAAWVLSSASGKELQRWTGTDTRGGFGGIVASVADLDGDGKGDVAVAAPGTEDQARTLAGEVRVYSSATGKELRRWSGRQPGELYGRMVVATGDLDGDGVDDVAIGAPWHRRGADDRVGRVEFRSGRSGALLGELVGDGADCWFGWHIRRAPDPEGQGRPALLIGSLTHPVDGKVGVGVIDLYVRRPAAVARRQGTITRRTRRKDIR